MSQNFEIKVSTLKHEKLLARAQDIAIVKEKAKDQQTLQQVTEQAISYFEQNRYWWVNNGEMIFDRETGLLWQGQPNHQGYSLNDAHKRASQLALGDMKQWKLPALEQIKVIVQNNFPLLTGTGRHLCSWSAIMHSQGGMWLDSDYPRSASDGRPCLYVLENNQLMNSKSSLIFFLGKQWKIRPCFIKPSEEILSAADTSKHYKNNQYWFRNPFIIPKECKQLKDLLITYQDEGLKKFYKNLGIIQSLSHKKYDYKPQVTTAEIWQDIDYITTRLPKLDALRFSDVEQGMWEFFIPKDLQSKTTSITLHEFVRARDPSLDIQEANVAIDFGTSSTVVAIRKNGRDELLRIGMQEKDFAKDGITDQQYENPTVLEFLDLQSFLNDWKSESYRPLVNWDHIHCSHEARADLRNNDTNSKVVSSIFARLKQWALRDENQAKVRIRDQKDYEYQLKSLAEFNPVKGQVLDIGKNYPELDPIEIYAWFLGMNINWRSRGIFLNYYLTFPVAYPNDVKAKILAAFRRGLQRSLPEPLIHHERFTEFSVEELASEPAAFATSALQRLEIEPVDGGVSYAVFDFGGGTTDFDYGFYRTPTEEEEDEGWDHVIEHFGSSGDKFLGGENLLENLAYLVFQNNSSECRKKNIAFTKPLEAQSFAGSELLIAQTQAAYTNTTLMMSKLRPLWEKGQLNFSSEGIEQFKLMNKDGQAVECEIKISQPILIEFLQTRIREGLKQFFIALKIAFEQQHQKIPELIHILLAGNSSRSRIVLGLLGRLDDDKSKVLYDLFLADLAEIFEDYPEFEIHLPLDTDPNNPYAPTAKTGVALGLLRLCPGERLKIVNHAAQANVDSPFHYFVGAFRRDVFQPALRRGYNYDEWVEVGRPLNGVFMVGYTTSAKASLENGISRGESGLFEKKLTLSGNLQGHKVFAKIISPTEIEVCTAPSLDSLEQQQMSNYRIIELAV